MKVYPAVIIFLSTSSYSTESDPPVLVSAYSDLMLALDAGITYKAA